MHRERLQQWIVAPLVALVCTAIFFPYVGRHSAYVVVDSGAYLSMAHNLASHGKLVSGFNYLGNFAHLPAPPNFAPPGLSLLVAALQPFTGDAISAAKGVLFLSLFLLQLLAIWIVMRCTGAGLYAAAASLVLLFQGGLLVWSAAILTELPFMAILAGALLAAVVVLEGDAARWVRFGALPLATALLCLTRFLGVFFPLAFSLVYLGCVFYGGEKRRESLPRALGYLTLYNALSLLPLVIWVLAAGSASTSLLPHRPPSQLGLGRALMDMTAYLSLWFLPWYVLGFLLSALRLVRKKEENQRRPFLGTEGLFTAMLFAYLGLLLLVRTRQAHYPLTELGARYMAPAWLPAFFLAACLLHRMLKGAPRRLPHVLTALVAAGVVWWSSGEVRSFRLPPTYPLQTETYQGFLRHVPPASVVLCNYGQPLVAERPESRVIGIASTQDLHYELDLPSLLDRHELEWIVLFDNQGREGTYPPWFHDWLRREPAGVPVLQTFRFRDGVIYQLER